MNEEAVREKLAAVLASLEDLGVYTETRDDYVDALLPVVREIAAEELRESNRQAFAEETRADALTKPPDGPVR